MMQKWFNKAKLGVFIHWGVYAIQKRGGESWPIANGEVSYNDYMTQIKDFTASQYDPDSWSDLIEKSGAKYAVLTTKHHDGVTLWPTKQGSPSVCSDVYQEGNCPDLVKPFVNSLRKKGIHTGLYFSHTDWSHDDHCSVIGGTDNDEVKKLREDKVVYRDLWSRDDDKKDLASQKEYQKKWDNFLTFEQAQLKEILTNYGDIDLLWFDVMLARKGFKYPLKKIKKLINSICPETVVNSRLGDQGDYDTPEQFIPVYPPEGPWELCITTNNTWSYTGKEEQYKSPYEIITMFCECLGMGGNMLLNVGPDEKGIIPAQQVKLLETLGQWVKKHEEAVYETERGLPHGYTYNFTSFNSAKDTIYLYLSHVPVEGTFIKGIRNEIKSISILGEGTSCSHKRIGGAPWLNVPGTLCIHVPKDKLDPYVTVLKIELEGNLDLHSGIGVEIDEN